MAKGKVIILGAGLAGLSAAWHLQRAGIDCQVFEQEPEVGGLCRSRKINGFVFDCSGHLLHFKHTYPFRLIRDLLGSNFIQHKRSAWIYSFNRFSPYPFQANLYGLPKSVVKDCLLEFIKVRRNGFKIKDNVSFREWIDKTFGKGIARHFMVPYNTKFWTVPLDDLTCEWIDGFIPVPTLNQIIGGTIEESKRNIGYNAFFWYPVKGGISEVPFALASGLKDVFTGCRVTKIDLKAKQVRLNGRQQEKFDFLISTLPLPEMPGLLGRLPEDVVRAFKNLRWNSIYNLNLGIEKRLRYSGHWAYFPGDDICFFRVGFPHNFSAHLTPAEKSAVYAEVSYSAQRPVDKDNIALRIKRDLKKVGLLTKNERIYVVDINDIKYGYPIYDVNYRQSRQTILTYLSRNNIISCGRYGSWRYLSMEDVLLDGAQAARRLLKR